jgi:ATP-dependent RNA helicase SUPV3L1/SUV3
MSAAAASRNVVAVLGPTNTGKTHLAIERMLAHSSGIIGLPLRLLAREVYNRIAARAGAEAVALITGEEKIVPANARYRVCTVEAMPSEIDAAFLAIDEIQLAGDLERGHVFTDRMMNLRGREETLLLGAATMRGIVEKLVPGVNVVTRPRMSLLTYSGSKKITRLPRRSAVVAFSADEVYAIAELIRRQRGGAAVVLGSLSPRTRNAQVELFQSGDVDFLVATDAIGMGLNLDLDHVAFAADRKFDGYQYRRLSAGELGQIAGRAGRHIRDGTFGVTSRVEPFEDALVEALESHRFDPVKVVQWRNRDLDLSSLDALKHSLDRPPSREGLTKAPPADDERALDMVVRDPEVKAKADRPARVALLWDVCQVPDYRRIAPANHAELVATLFGYLADGFISDDWFAGQVTFADRTDGDIDTLANRIAHIRTWTFAANRPQWLADPSHWQERTRAIEDRLSDALHERLTARFVDRRTSVLMRRLKENAMLEAEISAGGDVSVEGQHVGTLAGFRFTPDANGEGPDGKALRLAAQKALAGEIAERAEKVATAANPDFILGADGSLRWQGAAVAKLAEGDDPLKPRLILLADEALTGPPRDRVQARVDLWLATHIETLLKPLFDLRNADTLAPAARGIAFRIVEQLGVVERATIAEEIRSLEQDARAGLRTLGVRFGAYHIYVPALIKPAPAGLLAMLWALKNGGLDTNGLAELSHLAASGRTSVAVDPAIPRPLYRIVGYRIAGNRAVRVDILERLADIIRPLIAWRVTPEQPTPPPGAAPGNGFTVTVAMTSLLGCSGEDFASVLRSLGYRVERKPAPPKEAVVPTSTAEQAPSSEPTVQSPEAPEKTGETEAIPSEDAEELPPATDAAGPPPQSGEGEPAQPVEAAPPANAGDIALQEAGDNATDSFPGTPAELGSPETTTPAPVSEASTPVSTPSPDAPTPAAEPSFIEIWRPGRHDRPRREDHPPRRHRQPPRPSAPPAESAAEKAAQPQETAARPRQDRRPRPERPNHHGKPRNDRPRPAQFQKPQENRRPPERRDKPVDPDSPFAALAALKAQLEAKDRS